MTANHYTSTALASTVIGVVYTVDGTEYNIEAAEGNAFVLIVDGGEISENTSDAEELSAYESVIAPAEGAAEMSVTAIVKK